MTAAAQAQVNSPTSFPSGQFVQLTGGGLLEALQNEIALFEREIDPAVHTQGVQETPLLEWFRASPARIAILAIAQFGYQPTHVAKELTLNRFRADFAWANIQPNTIPTFCFIEFEAAEQDTLFRQGQRSAPYYGRPLLDGFSQLADWCFFGKDDAMRTPSVSAALGSHPRATRAEYHYSLIAGLDCFASDLLSQQRLTFWRDNMKLGHGTTFSTYTRILENARSWVTKMQSNIHAAGPVQTVQAV